MNHIPDSNISLSRDDVIFRNILKECGVNYLKSSYNDAIERNIPNLINNLNFTCLNYTIKFIFVNYNKKFVLTPTAEQVPMYPKDCIRGNCSYTISPIVNIEVTNNDTSKTNIMKDEILSEIPIMIRSKICSTVGIADDKMLEINECPKDSGGYFILEGSERTYIMQERLRHSINLSYFNPKKDEIEISKTCKSLNSVVGTTVFLMKADKKWKNITVKLQHCPKDKCIPLIMIYKILGIDDYNEMLKRIMKFVNSKNKKLVKFAFVTTLTYMSNVNTIEFIRELRKEENIELTDDQIESDAIGDILSDVLNLDDKINGVSLMAASLMETLLELRQPINRDSWSVKKIESPGKYIERLFRVSLFKIIETFKTMCISDKITDNSIQIAINKSIMTVNEKKTILKGFSPVTNKNEIESIKRVSLLELLSQLLIINTPLNRQSKKILTRAVISDQIHYCCVAYTTEGEACGLKKALASHCIMSSDHSTDDINDVISDNELFIPFKESNKSYTTLFLINGIVSAKCIMPDAKNYLISLRRNNKLPFDCCIYYNDSENILEYYCDSSRPMCPLYIVENDRVLADDLVDADKMTLNQLISSGVVELVDSREQANTFIAYNKELIESRISKLKILESKDDPDNLELYERDRLTKHKFTHCEIHPVSMFSIACGVINFANRMQGPRIVYQAGMGKQALGEAHSTVEYRNDTTIKCLVEPAKPICSSILHDIIGLSACPNGKTIISANYAFADNNEDATVWNADAIDASMFKTIKFTTEEMKSKMHNNVKFGVPVNKQKQHPEKYHAIDNRGYPILNKYIHQGDCLIGRLKIFKDDKDNKNAKNDKAPTDEDDDYEDSSLYAGIGSEGFIDRVFIHQQGADIIVRVKLRDVRVPHVGDKATATCAQKVTITRIEKSCNLPRIFGGSNHGLVPTLFKNPHSFPSRMTQGLLVEELISKAALYTGKRINCTAFQHVDVEYYKKILEDNGINPDGKERMMLPSGRLIKNRISVGAVYYQILKHQAEDKIQTCSRGPIKELTRQPAKGKSQGGGLKLGEMESDAMKSHGASSTMLDRHRYCSDETETFVCKTCNSVAISKISIDGLIMKCNVCKYEVCTNDIRDTSELNNRFAKVKGTYIFFKLIANELAGLNMGFKFYTENISFTEKL
jgi:DNA-directed RNA polymerase II subunit RPB2